MLRSQSALLDYRILLMTMAASALVSVLFAYSGSHIVICSPNFTTWDTTVTYENGH